MKRTQEIDSHIHESATSKEAINTLKAQIAGFKEGWRKGSLAAKKRLFRAIIERLDVSPGVLGVCRPYPLGSEKKRSEADLKSKKAVGNFVIPTALSDVDLKNGVRCLKQSRTFSSTKTINHFERAANPALSERVFPPRKI